jgi:hypothetical protein
MAKQTIEKENEMNQNTKKIKADIKVTEVTFNPDYDMALREFAASLEFPDK